MGLGAGRGGVGLGVGWGGVGGGGRWGGVGSELERSQKIYTERRMIIEVG